VIGLGRFAGWPATRTEPRVQSTEYPVPQTQAEGAEGLRLKRAWHGLGRRFRDPHVEVPVDSLTGRR
jgi:hypothetical protein